MALSNEVGELTEIFQMNRLVETAIPGRLGRTFRWLLASSWVTNLGDGITLAAGPLLVASQTRNPLAIAMAVLLQRLPWLMFGLFAGVLADRADRRAIVIVTGLVRAAVLVLLTASILTRRVDTAVVLAVLFLFGINETFGDTAASTVLPMVDKSDLGIANSRTLTGVIVWNQLAGPPIGAALPAGHGRGRLRTDHDRDGRGRSCGHRILWLAGAARPARHHHARRAHHRDADPSHSCPDPLADARDSGTGHPVPPSPWSPRMGSILSENGPTHRMARIPEPRGRAAGLGHGQCRSRLLPFGGGV